MSSTDQLTSIIAEVMQEQGRELSTELESATQLRRDLGFDSLELAILTVRIEAEFGVDVFADGVVNTIGELRSKLGMD